jgi:hypothetical protein
MEAAGGIFSPKRKQATWTADNLPPVGDDGKTAKPKKIEGRSACSREQGRLYPGENR